MRVNVYAEEMTHKVEIVEKTVEGQTFTGVRFYLELPVSVPINVNGEHLGYNLHRGPFLHRPGDDDSSAVTFWGKTDARIVFQQALDKLNAYYEAREQANDKSKQI